MKSAKINYQKSGIQLWCCIKTVVVVKMQNTKLALLSVLSATKVPSLLIC